MTVLARDAGGNPAAGVPISWTITQGQGTIVRPAATTDSTGLAGATFLGTDVPFGLSFTQATVTASSPYGSVSFFVTTSLIKLQGGGQGSPPLVELLAPIATNLTITGSANAILPGAIKVRVSVAAGPQAGQLLANIGIDMHFYNDDEPLPAPFATCRGGTVLTDVTGVATCDLVLNDQVGQVQIAANAGEVQKTRPILLTITPGVPCAFSISPAGQAFSAAGGTGVISLSTGSSCSWAAASNANWVVLSGPVAGSSSASVGFAVATNSGAARSSTITVGSQIFSITQAAAGTTGTPLTVTSTSPLPTASVGTPYSYALQASGGTPPYQWTATALPAGLLLNNGVISGTPAASGSFSIGATVTDAARASASQTLSLAVSSTPVTPTGPVITNASFPVGTVSQAYKQAVTFVTSCTSIFGAGPTISVSSGNLPPGLSLTSPVDKTWVVSGTPTSGGSYNFGLTITEGCGRSSTANYLLTISGPGSGGGGGTPGAITASPQSVSFAVNTGSGTNPAPLTVNLASSTGAALSYNAGIVNSTGGPWLSISSGASGTTPGSLTLSASNFQGFAPAIYTAQLALQSPGNATVFVPISLNVSSGVPLGVTPASLLFTSPMLQSATFLQQQLQVASAPTAHYSVGFSTDPLNSWLGVSPGSGDTPGIITVLVNPAGLRQGTYTGKVTVTAVNGAAVTVPVSLVVTTPPALTWNVPSIDNSYLTNGPAPPQLTANLASTASNLQFQVANPQVSWAFVDAESRHHARQYLAHFRPHRSSAGRVPDLDHGIVVDLSHFDGNAAGLILCPSGGADD